MRRQKVIWSIVEVGWLRKNKGKPIGQLCIALNKSQGAIKRMLTELKKMKEGAPLLSPGPSKNKRSYIGKRADCGGLFLRSAWEANVHRYLRFKKTEVIQYEPKTFTFTEFGIVRGTLSYTPDFWVAQEKKEEGSWIEVKGYLTPEGKTKLRRFKKYYPTEFAKLIMITGGPNTATHHFARDLGVSAILSYPDIKKSYSDKIPGWEG